MTFCDNLLALYPALWLFAAIDGVEPTNNHAERILRMGVLWRKNAFGCQSEAGLPVRRTNADSGPDFTIAEAFGPGILLEESCDRSSDGGASLPH